MKLEIPAGEFSAYLFDCDGTIVDSMPLHFTAWTSVLAEEGCPFPEEQFYAFGGIPPLKIVELLNEEHGLRMDPASVAERKENFYYAGLHELEAVHEVVEVIEAAHGSIPFAVVSGSSRESVERSLTRLDLLNKFPVRVCAEDYTHGKPAPECYLKAAALLGVEPSRCLVFEDTEMGIEAAKAAGMQWVRVPAPWERR